MHRSFTPDGLGRTARRISLATILVVLSAASAQTQSKALYIGAGLGLGMYHGEFNSLQGNFDPRLGPNGNLFLQYNFSEVFSLGSRFGYTVLPKGYSDDARAKYASNFFGPVGSTTFPGSSVAITDGSSSTVTSFELFAKYHIPLESVQPYGMVGLGLLSFSVENQNGVPLPTNLTGAYDTNPLTLPFGGGVEFPINNWLRGHGELVHHRTFTDYLDGYAHFLDFDRGLVAQGPGTEATPPDHFTILRAGVTAKLWQAPPEDPLADNPTPPGRRGAVGDEPTPLNPEEVEPSPTPEGEPEPPTAEVDRDSFGIDDRPDSDNDQIPDELEIAVYNTNPLQADTDGDGLLDGEEVMLYATDPLRVDSDGDYLSDLAEVRTHGTSPRDPDTDRDYAYDGDEYLRLGTDPHSPDTDGDGVIDGRDLCPLDPGPAENDGCPPDRPPIRMEPVAPAGLTPIEEGQREEFSNIFFQVNSDELDFSRSETAENLVTLLHYLESCPEGRVLIEGHTSSEGNPAWNLQLSKMRADRVREWLLDNGAPEQTIIGTVGYGSRLPKLAEPLPGTISAETLERIRKQNRRITALIRQPCQ